LGSGPGMGMGLPPGAEDDPILKLLAQMMGGGGPGPGAAGGGNLFAANNPFAAMGPGGIQQQQQQAPVPDWYSSIWRLLHTAVALGLGLYIALWTSFSGTRLERDRSAVGSSSSKEGEDGLAAVDIFDSRRFFWAFATAETLLLTTRYFLDRARAVPPGGGNSIIWTLASFLPQPLRGYLEIAMRYVQIFSTVKADILVCIFVLGACSWLRAE
jgi:hypothetical protein